MATNILINLPVADDFSGSDLALVLREFADTIEQSSMNDDSLSIYPAMPIPVRSPYLLEDGFWVITDGDDS